MYTERNSIFAPPADTVLWRYMDFTKFVSLLDREALFFARVDKLGDPFEGSFSLSTIHTRSLRYGEHADDIDRILSGYTKEMRRFTAVSCWHESPYESEAMWQRYSREGDGIAIRTTFGDFTQSFMDSQEIYAGRVTYIDYANDFVPESDPVLVYLYKRKPFEHEKEVRAIIRHHPTRPDPSDPSKIVIDASMPALWGTGFYVQVDLSLLLRGVVVAPLAPDWFADLTASISKTYGLQADVVRSVLADDPSWGLRA